MGGVIDITTGAGDRAFERQLQCRGRIAQYRRCGGSIGGKSDNLMWHVSGTWLGTSGIPAFDEKLGGTRLCASQIGGGTGRLGVRPSRPISISICAATTCSRAPTSTATTRRRITIRSGTTTSTARTPSCSAMPASRCARRTAPSRTASPITISTPIPAITIRTRRAARVSPSTETFYGVGHIEREEYQGTWQFSPGYRAVFGAQHERSSIDSDTPAYDFSGPGADRRVSDHRQRLRAAAGRGRAGPHA